MPKLESNAARKQNQNWFGSAVVQFNRMPHGMLETHLNG